MKSYIRAVLGREKAFTLIELLIVIAIIAILTVAFLPGALKAPAKARDAQRVKSVQDIGAALEAYAAERNGVLPTSNATFCLNATVTLLSQYFANNAYPVDPKPTTNGSCNTAATNTVYFYRAIGNNYVVGALMELSVSANSTANFAAAPDLDDAGTTFVTIQAGTAQSAGGTAITPPMPNTATPMYLTLGPR